MSVAAFYMQLVFFFYLLRSLKIGGPFRSQIETSYPVDYVEIIMTFSFDKILSSLCSKCMCIHHYESWILINRTGNTCFLIRKILNASFS